MTAPTGTRADEVVAGDTVVHRGMYYAVEGVTLGCENVRLDVTPYSSKSPVRRLVLRRRELLEVTHV